MSPDHLPDARLSLRGKLGARFEALGIQDYRSAAWYVRDLPYGRNSDRSDYHLVLTEGRGTCSTKHALLAALAREQEIDVGLRIGIYLMDGTNTPGVGGVLAEHGFPAIPEAHCYLTHSGRRVDVTTPGSVPIERFAVEETVTPEQIGAHKAGMHRAYLKCWARAKGLDFERVWMIREECIAALSSSPAAER